MKLGLAYPITHQMQPTNCSCVATCVAMALGMPVQELGVDLNRPFDFDDFGPWLAHRGLWLRTGVRNGGRGESFHNGAVYLVGIRSLNVVASDHAVLLDTRGARKEGEGFSERSGWITYDPNQGREGRAVCEWADENLALDFAQIVEPRSMFVRSVEVVA